MKWKIQFSGHSLKFIEKENIEESKIIFYIKKAINKLKGEPENIDIKKMRGKWRNFYRLRIGRIRIIIKIDFDKQKIFIDRIDFRGKIYKN